MCIRVQKVSHCFCTVFSLRSLEVERPSVTALWAALYVSLAAVPPSIRSDAKDTYNTAHKAVTKGLSTSRLRKDNTAWKQWDTFCTWLHIPKDLQDIKDKIQFLQIIAHKVRTGVLAANNKPIHNQSVDQYLRSVGQIFTAMGAPDPRLNSMGAIDFCLGR